MHCRVSSGQTIAPIPPRLRAVQPEILPGLVAHPVANVLLRRTLPAAVELVTSPASRRRVNQAIPTVEAEPAAVKAVLLDRRHLAVAAAHHFVAALLVTVAITNQAGGDAAAIATAYLVSETTDRVQHTILAVKIGSAAIETAQQNSVRVFDLCVALAIPQPNRWNAAHGCRHRCSGWCSHRALAQGHLTRRAAIGPEQAVAAIPAQRRAVEPKILACEVAGAVSDPRGGGAVPSAVPDLVLRTRCQVEEAVTAIPVETGAVECKPVLVSIAPPVAKPLSGRALPIAVTHIPRAAPAASIVASLRKAAKPSRTCSPWPVRARGVLLSITSPQAHPRNHDQG
jgi:hypothetical protein